MKIILGSKNLSKKRSIEIALNEMGIVEYTIKCVDVPSRVSYRRRNINRSKKQDCGINKLLSKKFS